MSPRSTFHNCGNSSSRVRRKNLPDRRDARDRPAWPTPAPVSASASARIDRNLCTVKMRPCSPTRGWWYRTGPCDVSLDTSATIAHQRQRQDQQPGDASVTSSARLQAINAGSLSEAGRKDQPARPEVLDGDLSGVLLVDRRQVIELDALQLHLEQLVHRQLAARIGKAHHDAIDAPRADDCPGCRRSVPMTPGLMHRRTDLRRIGIDESDDLDAQLVAPLEQLPRKLDAPRQRCRRAAGARAAPCCRRPFEHDAASPMTNEMTSTAAMTNTPRPIINDGNQK